MALVQVELLVATFSIWTMVTVATSNPSLILLVRHPKLESSWPRDSSLLSSTNLLLKPTTLTKNNQANGLKLVLTTLVMFRRCKTDPLKCLHRQHQSALVGTNRLITVVAQSKDTLSSLMMETTETLLKQTS